MHACELCRGSRASAEIRALAHLQRVADLANRLCTSSTLYLGGNSLESLPMSLFHQTTSLMCVFMCRVGVGEGGFSLGPEKQLT
jgi:hypothetical protein